MAFYAKRDLLILDEPTSAIDDENEQKLMEQLMEITEKQTVICISHNQSVLKNFDRILNIKNHTIIEVM